MGIQINGTPLGGPCKPQQAPAAPTGARRKPSGRNAKRRDLSETMLGSTGRLRVGHWLTLLDISAPTLYAWIKRGRVPEPDGRDGAGHPYWLASTVRAYRDAQQSSADALSTAKGSGGQS